MATRNIVGIIMTIDDLIRINGIEKMQQWYTNQIGNTPTFGKYICHDSKGNLTGVINCGKLHVESLKKRLEEIKVSEVQKFICISRWDAKIVEGKIGKKYIMVDGDRFTKFNMQTGGAVGRRSSDNGFYSSHLYPIDNDYAKLALRESQTKAKKQAVVNFVNKLTDLDVIDELYEIVIKNSGGGK